MKSSIIVVACFMAGILIGKWGIISANTLPPHLSTYLLYVLIIQVGLGIGISDNIGRLHKDIGGRAFLIPFGTIVGSLLFAGLVNQLFGWLPLSDCMAVGSGFGYYSLSSVLITELKAPYVGIQLSAQLGALGLLVNIFRELTALCLAPLFNRYFGRYGVIAAAGVTSADVLLPSIIHYSGKEMIPPAIINSIVLELSVPFLVSFFCSVS